MPTVNDIASVIEQHAPLHLQEEWDNCGLQVGHRDRDVTGVLVALDPTPERISEAVGLGANMIVSHHPLIFKGIRNLTDSNRVQRAIELAIKYDVAVYSAHTSLDNAPYNVSALVGDVMEAETVKPLMGNADYRECGTGVVCALKQGVEVADFIARVKKHLRLEVVRTSDPAMCADNIDKFAVCGGSGGSFIPHAIAAGAQAYITGDIRYHDFIEYADKILLVDCGHFETEILSRKLLKILIQRLYPELPVHISQKEHNPVFYH